MLTLEHHVCAQIKAVTIFTVTYFQSNDNTVNTVLKCVYRYQARREGGQKGLLSGDTGGPGFRIVRFRMQNSSAQTTACIRDDVFFYFGPKFDYLRTL